MKIFKRYTAHCLVAAAMVLFPVLTCLTAAASPSGAGGDKKGDGFFIKDNDRVVFLGDSITHQRLYTTYIEAYTLTRFPEYNLTFRNCGFGGDTATLTKRFKIDNKELFWKEIYAATGEDLDKMVEEAVHKGLERDVLPLQPTVVTIEFGMNDHKYRAFQPEILRVYVRSQEELVRTLKKNGARVALITPNPIENLETNPKEDVRNISLRKLSDGLEKVAAAEGVLYIDQFDPYMEIISKRPEGQTQHIGGGRKGDSVHPGPCGHAIMAWTVLKKLNAPALVSSATIDISGGSNKVATENCTVSDVSYANGVLLFDRLDKALPMPIDKRALPALELVPIIEDLNRYSMCINGLADGEYEMLIDGKPVTTITSAAGKACINLATVETPASKQADKLLYGVFRKGDAFANRWRNVQLKNPEDPKLMELDKKIADMEASINALRKPVSHHFEIRPYNRSLRAGER